jgi:hypothetical protein
MTITIGGVVYTSRDIRLGELVKDEVYAQKQREAWEKFLESGSDEDFTKADEWWMKRVLLFLEHENVFLPDLSLSAMPITLEAKEQIEGKRVSREEVAKQIEALREESLVEIALAGEDKKAHEAALKNFQAKSKVLQAEFQKHVVKSTQQGIESFFVQLVAEIQTG